MKHINDILAKHFSQAELTNEEQSILSEWSENNKNEYKAIEKSWNSVPDFEYNQFNHKNAWVKIENKIEDKTKIKSIFKYAMVASIALLLSIGSYNYFNNTNIYISFENNSNTTKSITLDDGSIIDLAKHTTIEYQEDFANNRNVKLDGEAFFNVNRDEKHPFIITTLNGEIEVLGTSFNINTNNEITEVNVTSGLVEVRNTLSSIKLKKNETATINGSTITGITTNNPNYLSWKTGSFIFNDTPIKEVIHALNKYYSTEVILDKNTQTTCSITGVFEDQKIEDIVEAITLSCNLVFIKENNQITIK